MREMIDLFKALGGPAAMGRIVGKSTEHVCAMRRRRSIPTRYWPALIAAAQEKGIALDEATLVRIHLAPTEPDVQSDQAAPHAV